MPLFLSDIEPLCISTLPSNLTTPEPLGVIAMFLFEADTIALVSTSKSPPKLGELSSETFDRPAPEAAVADINDKLPEPSVASS